MKVYTTAEAARTFGRSKSYFSRACRAGKVVGATREGTKWLMPAASVEALLDYDSQAGILPERTNRLRWAAASGLAVLLGFVVDILTLHSILQRSERYWLWTVAIVITISLWLVAQRIATATTRRGTFGYAHSLRWLRQLSVIIVWTMPALLAIGLGAYMLWWYVPAGSTVVLVADIVDPAGIDSARVTQSLVDGMRATLQQHPLIEVRRLGNHLNPDISHEAVRSIARKPQYKAAFVIWGDYTLSPEPELYLHLAETNNPYPVFGEDLDESFEPELINHMGMFKFKQRLGQVLGQTISLASGVALMTAEQHSAAASLFDTAVHASDRLDSAELHRIALYYRGINALLLGRSDAATSDLTEVIDNTEFDTHADSDLLAKALSGLAMAEIEHQSWDSAASHLARANAFYTERNDLAGVSYVLMLQGHIALKRGHGAEAQAFYENSRSITLRLDEDGSDPYTLYYIGGALWKTLDLPGAKKYFVQALDLFTKQNDKRGIAVTLTQIAKLEIDGGLHDDALARLKRALELCQELNSGTCTADVYSTLGDAALMISDHQAAEEYYNLALATIREMQLPDQEADVLFDIGVAAWKREDYGAADSFLNQSLDLYSKLKSESDKGRVWGELGIVAQHREQFDIARQYYSKSLTVAIDNRDILGEASNRGNIGGLEVLVKRFDAGRIQLEQALKLDVRTGRLDRQANHRMNLCAAHVGLSQYNTAWNYCESSLDMYSNIGDPQSARKALFNIWYLANVDEDRRRALERVRSLADRYSGIDTAIAAELTDILHRVSGDNVTP